MSNFHLPALGLALVLVTSLSLSACLSATLLLLIAIQADHQRRPSAAPDQCLNKRRRESTSRDISSTSDSSPVDSISTNLPSFSYSSIWPESPPSLSEANDDTSGQVGNSFAHDMPPIHSDFHNEVCKKASDACFSLGLSPPANFPPSPKSFTSIDSSMRSCHPSLLDVPMEDVSQSFNKVLKHFKSSETIGWDLKRPPRPHSAAAALGRLPTDACVGSRRWTQYCNHLDVDGPAPTDDSSEDLCSIPIALIDRAMTPADDSPLGRSSSSDFFFPTKTGVSSPSSKPSALFNQDCQLDGLASFNGPSNLFRNSLPITSGEKFAHGGVLSSPISAQSQTSSASAEVNGQSRGTFSHSSTQIPRRWSRSSSRPSMLPRAQSHHASTVLSARGGSSGTAEPATMTEGRTNTHPPPSALARWPQMHQMTAVTRSAHRPLSSGQAIRSDALTVRGQSRPLPTSCASARSCRPATAEFTAHRRGGSISTINGMTGFISNSPTKVSRSEQQPMTHRRHQSQLILPFSRSHTPTVPSSLASSIKSPASFPRDINREHLNSSGRSSRASQSRYSGSFFCQPKREELEEEIELALREGDISSSVEVGWRANEEAKRDEEAMEIETDGESFQFCSSKGACNQQRQRGHGRFDDSQVDDVDDGGGESALARN